MPLPQSTMGALPDLVCQQYRIESRPSLSPRWAFSLKQGARLAGTVLYTEPCRLEQL